jgi:hypothetical protein
MVNAKYLRYFPPLLILFILAFCFGSTLSARPRTVSTSDSNEMRVCDDPPRTSDNPLLGAARNLIIWPPDEFTGSYDPGTAKYKAVVEFYRALKEQCFRTIVMKFDLNRIKAAIDAGWKPGDMLLNINCCYTCDHSSPWLDLFLSDLVPLDRDNIEEQELPELKQRLIQEAAEWGYSDDHGAISSFYERWVNRQIDSEADCSNTYTMSLETMLKAVKAYYYKKHYQELQQAPQPNDYIIEGSDGIPYKEVDGFHSYYQDEPGIQQERRCRHREKCNGADIAAFRTYAQELDFKYNPGGRMTPLTIGDGRFSRNSITDGGDEGGLDDWIDIGDGIAFTYYHGRVRLLGIQSLALWPKDDQRTSWSEFAELLENKINTDPRLSNPLVMSENETGKIPEGLKVMRNTPAISNTASLPLDTPWELRYQNSFPWFKYGEEDEFLDLFSHAINEGFHSMAYYALEYRGSPEVFISELKNTITPLLKKAGWLVK